MLLYHRTTKALLEKILVENTLSSSNRKVWFQNPRVSFSKLANLYSHGELADKEHTFIGAILVEANEPICVVDVGED